MISMWWCHCLIVSYSWFCKLCRLAGFANYTVTYFNYAITYLASCVCLNIYGCICNYVHVNTSFTMSVILLVVRTFLVAS